MLGKRIFEIGTSNHQNIQDAFSEKSRPCPREQWPIWLSCWGDVVLIISLAADSFGIGGALGIGWKHLTGAAVGLFVMIYGIWLASRKAN